jgi:nucleotide-binding universal stress UspA family protein
VHTNEAPILICYDDTEQAKHAIKVAATLLPHRRAVVLDVASPLTPGESVAAVGGIAPDFAQINSADSLSRAELGAKLARDEGFTAEARTEVSAPTWQGAVDVADAIEAAAIVIGTRGQTGAREVFNGSFSHEVAEHAGRPVLIVPPVRS